MARPIKVGLSYFPLDTTFFSNEKIKNLRRKHGAIGILTYLNILCKVYGKDGYFFKIPGGDKESFYMDIAEEIASGNDQIRQVTSRVRETIHHLLEQGMLDRDLFEKDVISGIALQEQYVLSAYKARQKIKMDTYCLVDVLDVVSKNGVSVTETSVNATETAVNDEISTQIKIKENNIHSFIHACAREESGETGESGDNCGKPCGKLEPCEPSDPASQRNYIYGKLGGGLVKLSENEIGELIDRLGVDDFNHYVEAVRDAEAIGHHFGKPHFNAIIDMARKDGLTI